MSGLGEGFWMEVGWRSLGFGAAVALLYALARRTSSAPLRMAVVLCGLAGLTLLPVATAWAPRWEVVMPLLGSMPGAGTVNAGAIAGPGWGMALALLWLAGVGLGMGQLICLSRAANQLVKKARPVARGRFLNAVRETLALAEGRKGTGGRDAFRGSVRVFLSRDVSRPVVMGWFRPAILLPESASDWPEDRWRYVICHEVAHLARRDLWWQLFTRVLCICYWFNPFAWWLSRRLTVDREYLVDDWVLQSTGGRPGDYARHLLAIATEAARPGHARASRRRRGLLLQPSMLGATGGLEDRVREILEGRSRRRGWRRVAVLFLGGVTLALAACTMVSPVRQSLAGGPWTEEEIQLRLAADPFPGE